MSQSEAEKRAYQRGYNSARRRHYDRVTSVLDVAKSYRDRLHDLDTARQCQTCDRWAKGPSEGCRWGYCRADFEYMEPRMWVDTFVGEREPRQIVTHDEFGCVNWLPRKT